jgi:putative intracellular protease/amidase
MTAEGENMAQQTVHLAVYDTLSDWEHGFVVAGINDPQYQREPGRYRVVTVAATREPVTTMGGVRIVPDMSVDELSPPDSAMLVLVGAHTWDGGGNKEFADLARQFLDAGVPVAAICGGTFGLANAGLLDDRKHTSSAVEYLGLTANYRGAEHYQDALAFTDGPLITAGPAHALEFAKEIFTKLELYSKETLEAWYAYYRTGDPSHFYALMAASA